MSWLDAASSCWRTNRAKSGLASVSGSNTELSHSYFSKLPCERTELLLQARHDCPTTPDAHTAMAASGRPIATRCRNTSALATRLDHAYGIIYGHACVCDSPASGSPVPRSPQLLAAAGDVRRLHHCAGQRLVTEPDLIQQSVLSSL